VKPMTSHPPSTLFTGSVVLEEALLILKWGGVLTHAGRQQAEDLGKIYRMVMYPRCGPHDIRVGSFAWCTEQGRWQLSRAARNWSA
jgi:inositol hexakisphosphate/diphosphoinositol-pentakisphosphate kinase